MLSSRGPSRYFELQFLSALNGEWLRKDLKVCEAAREPPEYYMLS